MVVIILYNMRKMETWKICWKDILPSLKTKKWKELEKRRFSLEFIVGQEKANATVAAIAKMEENDWTHDHLSWRSCLESSTIENNEVVERLAA